MERYGSVRWTAIPFGLTYFAGIVLLGELLGSSADSTQTFTDHFNDTASRLGDLVGALLLLGAAVLAVPVGLTMRHELAGHRATLKADLLAGLAGLAAAGLVAAAGLLAAAPLWHSVGNIFDDPGLEPAVAAGIAQAGTALLLGPVFILGCWTALTSYLARRAGRVPTWLAIAGYVAAALSLLGVTVGAALPLGLWWIGLGFGWRQAEH